jgi:uncharacterized membrane protein
MNKTKLLTYTGIITALVFVTTYSIRIPVPFTDGYIHPGDGMVFLSAVILGWKYGAFAAGVGSMLADIIGGYLHWAVPTLLIKAAMALLIGLAMNLRSKTSKAVFALSTSFVWALFVIVAKRLLHSGVANSAEALMKEIGTAGSIPELERLSRVVQTELTLSAFVIIMVVIGIGLYSCKKDKTLDIPLISGMIASGLWMVMAYYGAAYIIYGNVAAPVFSIPMNLVQFVMGLIFAMAVYYPFKKYIIPSTR